MRSRRIRGLKVDASRYPKMRYNTIKMGGDYTSLRYSLVGSPKPSICRGRTCVNAGYKYNGLSFRTGARR